MLNDNIAQQRKRFQWYAIKVDVMRIAMVKQNIMRIKTKYIKGVYDVNTMLRKHNIRKGILFIHVHMCDAIKRLISKLDYIYGFIPNNIPCPIYDFDAFIASIAESKSDKKEDPVDDTIVPGVSETETIEDISVYQPGVKIIVTFGLFKDCIGYIQSVNYETKNITVKVILNDSDLEMITDINMFYAKVM